MQKRDRKLRDAGDADYLILNLNDAEIEGCTTNEARQARLRLLQAQGRQSSGSFGPAGVYQIKLRNAGGMTQRYAQKFEFHQGMLHLQDVPGFTWIYLHPGNTDDHTSGCILLGDGVMQNLTREGRLIDSTAAYERIYKRMASEIHEHGHITLVIEDFG